MKGIFDCSGIQESVSRAMQQLKEGLDSLRVQPLPTTEVVPPTYIIGMDGGGEDGDLPGICIICSECGQVVYSSVIHSGVGTTVEIPQSCPHCSVTGGCGDE